MNTTATTEETIVMTNDHHADPGVSLDRTAALPDHPVSDPLRAGLLAAGDQATALAASGDWESLAWGKSRLDAIARDLTALRQMIDADIARLLPERRVTVDGLGTVERGRTSPGRAWQSADLARHVARRAVVDPDSGEVHATSLVQAAQLAADAIADTARLTASTGWSRPKLTAAGVDPDEWCTVTREGRPTVTIHGDSGRAS